MDIVRKLWVSKYSYEFMNVTVLIVVVGIFVPGT